MRRALPLILTGTSSVSVAAAESPTIGDAVGVLWPWLVGLGGGLIVLVGAARLIVAPWQRVVSRVERHHRIIDEPDEGDPLPARVRRLEETVQSLCSMPAQIAALQAQAVASEATQARVSDGLRLVLDELKALRADEELTGRHTPVPGGVGEQA